MRQNTFRKNWQLSLLGLVLLMGVRPVFGQRIEDLFNGEELHDIRLTMAPADWVALHEKYLENGYYHCSLEWKGIKIPDLGIRSRGSQSRSPIKPSIGLDFSRYVSDQRLLGLKGLILRNLNQDASMMRERLAEALFARVGLPHEREAHARLFVNGKYEGVYLLVEPIDERFVNVRLTESSGGLYSFSAVQPPYRFEYRGADPNLYLPNILEYRSGEQNTAALLEKIRMLNEVPDERFEAEVGKLFDIPAFMAHAATEQVLAQWDGFLGLNGINNLYLYFGKNSAPGIPIVWDQDGAFDDLNRSIWEDTDGNVLMRRALAVPAYRQMYLAALQHAAEALGGEGGWMEAEVEKIYAQIRQAVYEDPVRLCRVPDAPGGIGSCTTEMFEAASNGLRVFALKRAAMIRAELEKAQWPETARISLRPGSIVNVASRAPVLVPGAIALMQVSLPGAQTMVATAYPLPQSLGGIRVECSKGSVGLYSVGPQGVMFLVPPDLPMGAQWFRIRSGSEFSNPMMVRVMPTSVGNFGILHGNGQLVSSASPAAAGEVLASFVTGAWPAGMKAEERGFSVLVGGKAARVTWAGAAPGWLGIQQVNFEVPPEVSPGSAHAVQFVYDGEVSAAVALAIR